MHCCSAVKFAAVALEYYSQYSLTRQYVYDKLYMFVHKLQSNLFNISAVFYEREILDLRFRNDMTVELVSCTEH